MQQRLRRVLRRRVLRLLLVSMVALAGAAAIAYAAGALTSDNNIIYACQTKSTGAIRIVTSNQACKSSEFGMHWNVVGPEGQKGEPGPAGTPGVVFEARNWCSGEGCPNALTLTSGDNHELFTVQRPTDRPPWDKAVVIVTINAVNYGSENDHGAVNLACSAGGGGMVFQVQPDAPITTTFQGPAQGQDDVVVRCSVNSPGVPDAGSYQIDIGWASATLLPASSIDSVDVP